MLNGYDHRDVLLFWRHLFHVVDIPNHPSLLLSFEDALPDSVSSYAILEQIRDNDSLYGFVYGVHMFVTRVNQNLSSKFSSIWPCTLYLRIKDFPLD